jgi:hypothetical protein
VHHHLAGLIRAGLVVREGHRLRLT